MPWSEWDWLALLTLPLLIVLLTVMSWLNSANSNQRQPQPLSQGQYAASANPSSSAMARATPTSQSGTAPPSMGLAMPPTPATVPFTSAADENAYVATLLQSAHSSMAQQRPMQALGLVLAAVRQQRGEEGVFDVLNQAREGMGLTPHANPVRQQREALQRQEWQQMDEGMAGLSLQADGAQSQPPQQPSRLQLPSGGSGGGGDEDAQMEDDDDDGEDDADEDEHDGEREGEASIVDGQVVDEAVRAGTHVQCRKCWGVIAKHRMQAHPQWCEAVDPHGGVDFLI